MSGSIPGFSDLIINLVEQFEDPYCTDKPYHLNPEQVEHLKRLSRAASNEKSEYLSWLSVVGELLVAASASKEAPVDELCLDQIGFMVKQLSNQAQHYDIFEHNCEFMLQRAGEVQS